MKNVSGIILETSSPKGFLSLCTLQKKSAVLKMSSQWEGPVHSLYLTKVFEEILCKIKQAAADKREVVASEIDSALEESEKLVIQKNVSFIALGAGPGRFTGVRVGISFAKALSYVYNIPVYPVSSLKILAEEQIDQGRPVLVLVNAFKNSLFTALYHKQGEKVRQIISPSVIKPEKLSDSVKEECICVGDGYEVYKKYFSKNLRLCSVSDSLFPKPENLARILHREFSSIQPLNFRQVQPVYLRSPADMINNS